MRISDWSSDVCSSDLLGLEAAHGLALRGMTVTVIHLMPTLMERQLDEAAGWLLKNELESCGQTILTGADTAEIFGLGKVEGVDMKAGKEIAADNMVLDAGLRHRTGVCRDAGLWVGVGVSVDGR